ncbi:major allergen Pru ar 1-like [Neltuma alba]|uniref:major allergen Pru ar 1-like n=1 Tax=Neltuma alba TaxID=207710 RepID=UPI0010A3BE8C|nr:major allergen Pru ar 1-like [Prosopis alba]
MGVYRDEAEYSSQISAPRLFKALVVDAENFVPKLLPEVVKSIQVVHGDGGPGSIRQIHIAEGEKVRSVKNRIDEMNEERLAFSYTTIEGDVLKDKFESIAYEVKFEAKPDGGSNNKIIIKYNTKGDYEMSEDEIKKGKETTLDIYKVVEAYLLQNPDLYA